MTAQPNSLSLGRMLMLIPGSLSLMKGGFPAFRSSSLISRTFLAQTFPWTRFFSSYRYKERLVKKKCKLHISFTHLIFYKLIFNIQKYHKVCKISMEAGIKYRFVPGSSWPRPAVLTLPASTECL